MRRLLAFNSVKFGIFLLLVLTTVKYAIAVPSQEKDGTIVVLVTWGDIDNTPANDVFIEAHGYVIKDKAEKSFVFRMAVPDDMRFQFHLESMTCLSVRESQSLDAGACRSRPEGPELGL